MQVSSTSRNLIQQKLGLVENLVITDFSTKPKSSTKSMNEMSQNQMKMPYSLENLRLVELIDALPSPILIK